MNKPSLDDARCVVIQSLQARLVIRSGDGCPGERSPGSKASLGVERAIDYALSPRRSQRQPAFLEHDVLRNARLAVRRSADTEARALTEIATTCAPRHNAFQGCVRLNSHATVVADRSIRPPSVRTSGGAGKVAGTVVVEHVTPEDAAVASDLERRLRSKVLAELGSVAACVLQRMIDGDTVPETAVGIGVSPRTVDRARNKIRAIASSMFIAEEVAA